MKRTSLALFCLALSGCGAPSTDGVDQFVANFATLQCAWEFRCCTDGEIKTAHGGKYATQADCVSYYELGEEDPQYIDRLAVRQGRLKVDNTKAQACLAAIMAEPCNPKSTIPQQNPFPMDLPACANVFDGVTPVGQPCQFVGECVAGAQCVSDQLTPGSGVCVPYQQLGQICNDSVDCDPSAQPALYCAKQDWKCHNRSAVGGPCAYTLDSAGQPTLPLLLECDTTAGDIYCDPVSNTCKQLPTAGQPCLTNPPPGVMDSCDPDPTLQLVCQTTQGSTTGTCMGPAKLNQPCSALIHCDISGECALPYFCNFNKNPATCDQLAQKGQPCSNGLGPSCDVTLYCDDITNPQMPTCQPLLPDGATCTSSNQCLSQICTGTVGTTTRVCGPSPTPIVMCSGR
jgi:hypothetical protein